MANETCGKVQPERERECLEEEWGPPRASEVSAEAGTAAGQMQLCLVREGAPSEDKWRSREDDASGRKRGLLGTDAPWGCEGGRPGDGLQQRAGWGSSDGR